MSNKTVSKSSKSLPAIEKKIKFPEGVTNCYIYVILCLLPLVVYHYYADIVNVKYYFYVGCSIILFVLLFAYGIGIVSKKEKLNFGAGSKIWTNISAPEKLLIGFLLVTAVSTFQSDYFFESFWGNEGRLTGLFLTLIYGISFLIISRFGRLRERLLDAFLFTGNLVCLFGITDYFKMDILGFKENIVPEQFWMCTSTIGNVNIYTVLAAMFAAISMILFIAEKNWKKRAYYYITLSISLMALLTGQSDNAYVSMLALLGLSPIYLFRYRWGVRGYGIVLATFLSLILCTHYLTLAVPESFGLSGIIGPVAKMKILPAAVVGVWLLLVLAFWMDRNNHKETVSVWWRRGWICLIGLVCLVGVYVLYDCNVTGNVERYSAIQNYVLFNDKWGTNRGYIWRIAMESYQEYPWYRKLVGFGPDTFGLITYHKYRPEMLQFSGEIYDSPHNEYIQYLVTAGAAGLFLYLSMIVLSIKRIWMKQKENPLTMAVLFALICYWAQAAVNINIPITAAIMWTLWGVSMAACRDE